MSGLYFSDNLVQVYEGDLVAVGSERSCYKLAGCSSLCVKIPHYRDRNKQQNKKEYEYYSMLSRKGIEWSRLARCHGWIRTNLGYGLVFDMIQNIDDSPSLTLDRYIDQYGYDENVSIQLRKLKNYLISNNILVCDLKEKNVACQKTSDGVFLMLIDGVGNRDFLKFSEWFGCLGKRKIERHWQRFEERLNRIRGG